MSLDFDVSKIEDKETICHTPDGGWSVATQSLAWACMSVEMGEITEANAAEFWARTTVYQKVVGSWFNIVRQQDGKPVPYYVTKEDIVAHIGFKTNVPTHTRRQWINGRFSDIMNDYVRDLERLLQGRNEQPFDPKDNAPKPNLGDSLKFEQFIESYQFPDVQMSGTVIRVFDSLAEDWGSDGEAAWAMRDVNEVQGKKGHWYAIVEGDDGETYAVASYEVVQA